MGDFALALGAGASQGLAQAQERNRQKEYLGLQKKRFDLEEKESRLKMDALKDVITGKRELGEMLESIGLPRPTGILGAAPLESTYAPFAGKEPRLGELASAFVGAGQAIPTGMFEQMGITPPKPVTVAPGATLGIPTPEGGFKPTYTAPAAPKPFSAEQLRENAISMRILGKPAYGPQGESILSQPERQTIFDQLTEEEKKKTTFEAGLKETAPTGLREFEMATGISPELRGTPDYQKKYLNWKKETKEAIQITSPFEQAKFAASLRKEFEDLRPVKDYRDTMAKFSVMQEAYKESQTTKNFIAVDQALITLFNKMTDPQSVVRESEYARTADDLALMNKLRGKISRITAGGPGLTPEDRTALMKMGKKFMDTYAEIYKYEVDRYRRYAEMSGLDPEAVAPRPKQMKSIKKPTLTTKPKILKITPVK